MDRTQEGGVPSAGPDRHGASRWAGHHLGGLARRYSSRVMVGFAGWQHFKFLFSGRNAAGKHWIYVVA